MKDVRITRLNDAIEQAERFIAAAKFAIQDIEKRGEFTSSPSYAYAEAKRQSMTLTRKLALVRRPAHAGGDRP